MLEPWSGSEFKGSRIRGGLGTFLRNTCCTTGLPECRACPDLPACAYGVLFETPVQPAAFPVLRLYEKAPHPFVLRPPDDRRRHIPRGDLLHFGLTPIGLAHDALPLFLHAFDQMGASGNYGGRFRVATVRSALQPGLVVASDQNATTAAVPPMWTAPPEPTGEITIALQFPWPLRLVVDRELSSAPQFIDLIRGLLRRLHVLATLYGGCTAPFEVLHPLLDLARTARHLELNWRHTPLERHSLRQNQTLPLDGVTGGLTVRGPLGPLVPFLEAGRWLHVGKGTSLGLGGFALEVKYDGIPKSRGATARNPHLARAAAGGSGSM